MREQAFGEGVPADRHPIADIYETLLEMIADGLVRVERRDDGEIYFSLTDRAREMAGEWGLG